MIITAQTLPLYRHVFECEKDHCCWNNISKSAVLNMSSKGHNRAAWLTAQREKSFVRFFPPFLFTALISLRGIIIHLMSWNNVIMKLAQPFFHGGNIIRKVLLKCPLTHILLTWHISYTSHKSPHFVKTAIRATSDWAQQRFSSLWSFSLQRFPSPRFLKQVACP